MRFSMKKKLRESALRARRRHLRESKKHSETEVFEDMVDDIAEELKNLTSRRVFDIAVDDERAHEGKEELLDSILSFIGGSVAARFEDEHNISDVDGVEAAEEAADRVGRKDLLNDFWEGFQKEKKDVKESRFSKKRHIKEADELEEREDDIDTFRTSYTDDMYWDLKDITVYGFKKGTNGEYNTSIKKGLDSFKATFKRIWVENAKDGIDAYGLTGILSPSDEYENALSVVLDFDVIDSLDNVYYSGLEEDGIDALQEWRSPNNTKNKVKESRFRARRGRIAEGTEISMAKARELSVNSFTDTSEEVIWAIFKIAKDEEDAQRIWEDPSPSEQKRVLKLAFDAADEDTLYWGDQEFNRDEYISESRFRKSRNMLKESRELRRMKLLAGMFKRA